VRNPNFSSEARLAQVIIPQTAERANISSTTVRNSASKKVCKAAIRLQSSRIALILSVEGEAAELLKYYPRSSAGRTFANGSRMRFQSSGRIHRRSGTDRSRSLAAR